MRERKNLKLFIKENKGKRVFICRANDIYDKGYLWDLKGDLLVITYDLSNPLIHTLTTPIQDVFFKKQSFMKIKNQ